MAAPAHLLARPWAHPAAAPVATGIAGAAACFALAVRDPNQPGSYGLCPFKAVTGLDCPGCGTLRAVHALTRADVAQAAGLNVLALALLPVVLVAWVVWLRAGLDGRGHPGLTLPAPLVRVLPWVVGVFWVVRNLPVTPFSALHS